MAACVKSSPLFDNYDSKISVCVCDGKQGRLGEH